MRKSIDPDNVMLLPEVDNRWREEISKSLAKFDALGLSRAGASESWSVLDNGTLLMTINLAPGFSINQRAIPGEWCKRSEVQ